MSTEDFWFYRRDVQRLQDMKRQFLRNLDRKLDTRPTKKDAAKSATPQS